MIRKQFTLYFENRPGQLARITRMLAKEGINIEGISVSESTDVGLVQVVASNAAKAKATLKRAGIPFTVQDVCLVPLKNKPGALSRVVSRLSKAGVNINYVYATACSCKDNGCDCYAVVSAPKLRAVEEACDSGD